MAIYYSSIVKKFSNSTFIAASFLLGWLLKIAIWQFGTIIVNALTK